MRPLVLCKAHTIAQRRRSPNVLVWSVKAREEWFKTLQRGAQESCDRRGAKQEQSDYLDSDNKPYDRTKHRTRHHLGSIEPRSRRKRSYWLPKDTIRSPNLKEILKCSCEVLKAIEMSQNIPHDRRLRGVLVYGGEKVIPSPCKQAYTTKVGITHSNSKFFPKKERKHEDLILKMVSLGFKWEYTNMFVSILSIFSYPF